MYLVYYFSVSEWYIFQKAIPKWHFCKIQTPSELSATCVLGYKWNNPLDQRRANHPAPNLCLTACQPWPLGLGSRYDRSVTGGRQDGCLKPVLSGHVTCAWISLRTALCPQQIPNKETWAKTDVIFCIYVSATMQLKIIMAAIYWIYTVVQACVSLRLRTEKPMIFLIICYVLAVSVNGTVRIQARVPLTLRCVFLPFSLATCLRGHNLPLICFCSCHYSSIILLQQTHVQQILKIRTSRSVPPWSVKNKPCIISA